MPVSPPRPRESLRRSQRLLVLALLIGLAWNLAPMRLALAAVQDSYASAYDLTAALATSGASLADPATNVSGFTRDSVEVNGLSVCGNYQSMPTNTYSSWYTYTAPAGGGWLTLSTLQPGTNFDTVLEVWNGSVASGNSVGCNDDVVSGDRRSELTISVTAGSTYYISIRRYGTSPMPLSGAAGSEALAFFARFTATREIYVDQVNGSDANPGSVTLPVRTIQHGVDLAPTNGTVMVAAGSYGEYVSINKSLTLIGTGNPDTSSITLQSGALLGAGSGGLIAGTVNVQAGALVADGILLAAAGGFVNVDGAHTESVTIAKTLILRSTTGATLDSPGTTITVTGGVVTITGLNISGATAALNNAGGTVTADSNWWGSATGPTEATNPGGTGSAITGAVNFRPWCTVLAPTCNATGGAATQLVFKPSPSSSTGGVAFPTQPVVEVQDANGNLVTSSNLTVTLAIANNPGSGTLAGTTTVQVSNGKASFSGLSIDKPGIGYTLQASASGPLTATSAAFDIAVGPVATFAFNPSPSDSTAGAAFPTQPTVEARDAGGNLVTSFNGTVTLAIASSPGGGTLSGTTTATASGGIASFSGLSINKAGNGYTLQASDGSATGTSAAFNIVAGAPTQLVYTSSPGDTRAGVAFTNQPVVVALDAFGNTAIGFTGPVTVTIAGGTGTAGAALGGTVTVNAINGVASFSGLSIDKIGTGYRLTASSAGLPPVDSNSFNITANGLVFTLQPVTTPAGQVFVVKVAAQDAANNTDTNFTGAVTLAIKFGTGAPRAALGGTVTVNAVNGVADFTGQGLNITKAATGYILIASTPGLAGAESQPFDITGGPAAQLAFATSPGNTPAGAPLTLVVEVRDAYGNLATDYTGMVDLSIASNPGGGTLGGRLSKAVSGGIASFGAADGVNIDRIGIGYTLHAASGSLPAVDSTAFNITASRLVFAVAPGNTPVGSAFANQPVLRAEDGFGTIDTTFTGPVTLAIVPGTGTSGALLNGTVTLAASGGVATFTRLSIDRVGTGYQLSAAAAGLPSATSPAFDITKSVLYAPLMLTPGYPDLVASLKLSISPVVAEKPVVVTVTITNQGNAPASQFWVDFYINPTAPPTAANQPWDKSCGGRRCEQGIAWYVDKILAPGESVTLTSTPGSYYAKNTVWNGSFNTGLLHLYVYADSWNPGVPTGAVYESNETNNRAEFHNTLARAIAPAQVEAAPPVELPALPPRPARPE